MKRILIGLGGFAAVLAASRLLSSDESKGGTMPSNVNGQRAIVPTSLVPGDHVWFWNGRLSTSNNIPQADWFGTAVPNDYAGHGGEIYYFVIFDNEIRRGQPHMKGRPGSFAWLHNNPGNIMGPQPNIGQYLGKFGWHNFLIFPSFALGFDAIQRYLLGNPRYRNLSIAATFAVYAPKSDGNNPDEYAAEVANAAGVSPLTLIHTLTPEQMQLVQEKIAQIEGTVPGTTLAYDAPELPIPISSILTHPDLV